MNTEKIDKKERSVPLANGRTLNYGFIGDQCVDMYIRLCAANGRELKRWYLGDFVNCSEREIMHQLLSVLESATAKRVRKS